MPAGRPTDYDVAFCEKVIEWGKQGKSITWMAAELDVVKQSVYTWMATYPEFLDAMTRARHYCQAFWEDQGQLGMWADKFNGSVWSRSMAARFPEDWREKSETALTGAYGGPLEVTEVKRLVIDPKAKE